MSEIPNILNSTLNGSAGSAQGRQGTTIYVFTISLAAGFVLFAVQFTVFLIVRNYLWAKRIYQPRSFLVPVKQRVKPPHPNPIKWLSTVFKIHGNPDVLQKAGMDAYFFLRYLSMCLKIFTPMAILIVPVLLPLNFHKGRGTTEIRTIQQTITGLDTLAWSNVSPEHTNRYWAHLILAVGVVAWVCYKFHDELIHYIAKRQEFLSSPGHRMKASSTTVLIQDIPEHLCNEESLEEMYGDFPGGIRRIWINRNLTALVNKDKIRTEYEELLENAETDMLRRAVKQSRKGQGGHQQESSEAIALTEATIQTEPAPVTLEASQRVNTSDPATTPAQILETCQRDLEYDLATQAAWTKYIQPEQRRTMRLRPWNDIMAAKIPLIGRLFATRVDVIYHCRRELARLNKEIELEVEQQEKFPYNGSAFVQFNSQKAAHIACQSVADTSPRHMRRRIIEISPGDINWPNLNLSWLARYSRFLGFLTLFILLVFAFGVISFFTGLLSSASTLSKSVDWLHWVETLPTWLLSFISGTLPPVIQVIVLSGPLPILIRLLTNKMQGATTGQEGERSLQLWYFIFLLFELFLIPTVSSGLTSIIGELIHTPGNVTNILAINLPTASNYYFSFLVLQALSLSATSILQTIRLFKYYVIGHVNTPDAVFEKLSWTNLTRIGSNIPWYTTFAVIGLVYSVIAPLMLLFVLLTFSLFWVVIKNNLLYCVRTGIVDGAGLWFPSAINQLFTGLYFMEVCLIGLFFLVRDIDNKVACDAQGIIMAVVLVLTFLYHIWLMNHLGPYFKFSPIRLEIEATALMADYEAKRSTDSDPQETAPTITLDPSIEKSHTLDLPSNSSTNMLSNMLSNSAARRSTVNSEQRPSMRLRLSTTVSHRSQDLQHQQVEDVKSAKRILARINRPLDDARLAQLENRLARSENRTGNILIPRRRDIEAQMMDDPISRIIMQHNDELENLDSEERDMLLSVAFTHPVLRQARPCVWIPRDELGISDDEIKRTKEAHPEVVIDNRGAFFDAKLKVQVDKPPPDMSEFALIMPEL